MQRLNLLLLFMLTVCALGLVSSQHKARRLVTSIESETARARELEIEYGKLQLELSTWATHARIEKLAGERLRMRAADPNRTQLVPMEGGAGGEERMIARALAAAETSWRGSGVSGFSGFSGERRR